MRPPIPRFALVAAGILAVATGAAVYSVVPSAPEVPVAPSVPVVVPAVVAPVAPVVVAPTAVAVAAAPTWEGAPVTVVCPLSASDASLRAACPEYFTSAWQTAAIRDGYTSGSQKLAKVDCAFAHLAQLDAVTAESLTCRDALNAAVYGKDGSGGGACATEIATLCKGVHPSPGSNPTDLCLQAVVTDGNTSTNLSAACATAVANHAYAEAAQTAGKVAP